jgi:hypothetical protein
MSKKAKIEDIVNGLYITTSCPYCDAKTSGFSLKLEFIRSCRVCKEIYKVNAIDEVTFYLNTCRCSENEKHGTTQQECCNECGKPIKEQK